MSKIHKRITLFFSFLIVMLFISVFTVGIGAQSSSQSSKDIEISTPPFSTQPAPSTSSTSSNQSNKYFQFWFELIPPGQSKKEFEFKKPSSTPKSPSELSELRYLYLGSIDQELALIIRLTDKAKERRIDTIRYADYLYSQQLPLRSYLSLSDRINNLILELCIYDLERVSRSEFYSYLRQIRINSYYLSQEENTFNYIIDLIENYVFSPIEAIDSLILLKQSATRRW